MPEDRPASRWSSARDREERARQREAARARARRDDPEPAPRRLTDEERRTIREYRFPSARERVAAGASERPASTTPPPATEAPPSPPASTVGTRWRDSAPPPPSGSGPGLPDLPDDGGGGRGRGGPNSRLILFALALFGIMAVMAFLPFGPLGGDDERDLPTPSATLPSILAPDTDEPVDDPLEEDTPAPGDGQPVVCIDPGHGGWDTGWNRTESGDAPYSPPIATEAEINLGMAWMLKDALEAEGIFVVMTRPSGAAVNMFDEDIDGDGTTRLSSDNPRNGARDELQARINTCNEAGADVLISLHLNGFDDRSIRGYEVLYTAERDFGQQNADLATFIYRQLDTAMRDTDMTGLGRGARPDNEIESVRHEFGAEQHMVMTGPAVSNPDYQIVPSAMPGVIVEAVFLSNDQDAAWIVQPANQRMVVDAYVAGILDYFEKYPA